MSKISKDLDKKVRESSKNRCGYCHTPQSLTSHKLEIEHIYPLSKGGTSEKENLCLACRHCNLHKAAKVFGYDVVSAKKVKLFNPNLQRWTENFGWDKEKTSIIGKTPCGRATVFALKINDELQTNARKIWKLTGLFPPPDW
ncbi:MAG TPA: HNH endonuclease signature motif containing protein [Pyrinomonadaceae bacterium]|nr:HNH endonuclease signature motif containing protein [Pyrinomonadaceae bacterium]